MNRIISRKVVQQAQFRSILTRGAGILFLIFLFSGCGSETAPSSDEKPFLVTTTHLIRDAVQQIAGDHVQVISLMGPGVDPHLYRATPGDFRQMEEADLILYHGLYLEGRLSEILARLGHRAVAVTRSIPESDLLTAAEYGGAYDPHIWFDIHLWIQVVKEIKMLLTLHVPEKESYFENRKNEYLQELDALHEWAIIRLSEIPRDRRILITAHDAFRYFGRSFNMKVKGLQGLSTTAEIGVRDVSEMVNLIIQQQIPAIFVESSVSTRSIESVLGGARSRGYRVRQGGMLYSDSTGPEGTPQGTYTGMFRHNVNTIVEALAPELETL